MGAVAGQEPEEDVDGGIGVRLDEVDRVVEPLRERPAHPLQQGGGRHQEQRVADDGVGAPGRADAAEHHAGSHPVAQLVRRFDETFSLRQRALQISEQHLGPLHPRVALSYEGLGQLKRMQGQLQESHRYYTEARRRIESALGPEHPRVASLLRAVGQVYSEEGRYREAEEALVRALAARGLLWPR